MIYVRDVRMWLDQFSRESDDQKDYAIYYWYRLWTLFYYSFEIKPDDFIMNMAPVQLVNIHYKPAYNSFNSYI